MEPHVLTDWRGVNFSVIIQQVGMKTPRLAYPINNNKYKPTNNLSAHSTNGMKDIQLQSESFLPRLSFGSRTPASRQSLVQRQHGCAQRLFLWLEVSGVRRHQLDDRNPTARNSPCMPVNVFESTFHSLFSHCHIAHEVWNYGTLVYMWLYMIT